MTSLATHLDHYLTVRRGFGYDLSTSERVLRRFTAFAGTQLLPAEAGRLKGFVSYGLKSFAHDLVT